MCKDDLVGGGGGGGGGGGMNNRQFTLRTTVLDVLMSK